MKNSIGVSEYMLFTKSFSEIKDLSSLGSIEERKDPEDWSEEQLEKLVSRDCLVGVSVPEAVV